MVTSVAEDVGIPSILSLNWFVVSPPNSIAEMTIRSECGLMILNDRVAEPISVKTVSKRNVSNENSNCAFESAMIDSSSHA